jgi:hypothetical protein
MKNQLLALIKLNCGCVSFLKSSRSSYFRPISTCPICRIVFSESKACDEKIQIRLPDYRHIHFCFTDLTRCHFTIHTYMHKTFLIYHRLENGRNHYFGGVHDIIISSFCRKKCRQVKINIPYMNGTVIMS